MIEDLSRDIFNCGTRVFMYALVHVMCLCMYVNMVCQRCMLYDDMYSHNSASIIHFLTFIQVQNIRPFFALMYSSSSSNFSKKI
jgi:hypothetical protein